jgi:hypothetical protein
MFTFPKTPYDAWQLTSDYFKVFPQNEAQLKEVLEKVKTVFWTETKNSKEMWDIYKKASLGNASVNELAKANKIAQELMTTTRFAFLVALPGTVFFLPLMIKFAKEHGVDLVPASVAKEFEIA